MHLPILEVFQLALTLHFCRLDLPSTLHIHLSLNYMSKICIPDRQRRRLNLRRLFRIHRLENGFLDAVGDCDEAVALEQYDGMIGLSGWVRGVSS